jgi:3-hydroxybutyryl-CoA dehydrogenase
VSDVGARAQRPRKVRVEGALGPARSLVELLRTCGDVELELVDGPGLLRVDGHVVALCDGRSATARAQALGEPVLLFDLALDFSRCPRVALAACAQASPEHIDKTIGLFTLLGKKVSLLCDAPGMVVTRTVAMLVNEAAEALQHGIASAQDIDAAMQHGVNYPLGPLAWGAALGFDHVLSVLRHLGAACGEDRYRPSLWLQRQGACPLPGGLAP